MTTDRTWTEFREDNLKLFNNLKTKTMNFKKISVNDEGFKGMECHFYQEEEKNGKKHIVLTKKYPKNPVHFGLEKLFKDLRVHLLTANQIINPDMDTNVQAHKVMGTKVHTVEMDGTTITLSGEMAVFAEKSVTVKTCKIQEEDEYVFYDELVGIVNDICIESEEYLAGTKKVEDEEVALRYLEAGKAKGVDIEAVKALPPEKLKEWATKFLENNYGAIVMHNDEVELNDDEVNAAVEELKTEFEITEGETVIPVAEEKPKKEKKVKAPKEAPVAEASAAGSPNDTEEF